MTFEEERRFLHELLADAAEVIDPEKHADLTDRIYEVLKNCNSGNGCVAPTVKWCQPDESGGLDLDKETVEKIMREKLAQAERAAEDRIRAIVREEMAKWPDNHEGPVS